MLQSSEGGRIGIHDVDLPASKVNSNCMHISHRPAGTAINLQRNDINSACVRRMEERTPVHHSATSGIYSRTFAA